MIHNKRGFIIFITLVASVLNSSCSHHTKRLWEFTRSPVKQSEEKFSKVLLVENQENLALIGQERHFIFPMTTVDNRFKMMLLGEKLRHFDLWDIYLEVDRSNSYYGRLGLKLNQSKSTLSQEDPDSLKYFCIKSELEKGDCWLSIHMYGGHLGQEADFNRLKNENLPSIV